MLQHLGKAQPSPVWSLYRLKAAVKIMYIVVLWLIKWLMGLKAVGALSLPEAWPPSQKLAKRSSPRSCEGRRSFCRRGTQFSAGKNVPDLWFVYRWLVGRYSGKYLRGCWLFCIACIDSLISCVLPGCRSVTICVTQPGWRSE